MIEVVEGDITRERVDAIVNAANAALRAGGGVDGAIHRAAGPELQRELDGVGGCPVGEARLSCGYRLPARWIIHCVGPIWRGGGADEARLLAGCYRAAFEIARERGFRSLAFPAIRTGIYAFPKPEAATIAVTSILAELAVGGVDRVRLVCFDADTATLYRDRLSAQP